ncbi:MAG TPA: hypothetical protein VM219_04845 [Phycisphaerae bacterium]|nr:hypothetical protein [Phycisphaerae bacterium]
MRTNRRLVTKVEREWASIGRQADAARSELVGHEIRTRIEGDKTVSDLIAPGFARLRERMHRRNHDAR